MESQVPMYKIIRHIASGGCEYDAEIREWIDASGENKSVYHDLFNIWQVTGSFPERFSPDRDKAWLNVHKHIHNQKERHLIYQRIAQVAATVILVFLSAWAGSRLSSRQQQDQYTEVISPSGQKTRVILPDSSVVLLNSGSQIRFKHDFNDKKRKVELKGEGYFEVRKDVSRQFIVSTSRLDIKVFGTTFNVKAYENDLNVEVGLKNGKVGIDCDDKEIVQLAPGQMATFDKKGLKLQVEKKDIDMVSAWTREEMVFEEATLKEIVKYMERWYGVEIQVDPKLFDGELLTFKVKTESLTELLNLIKILRPIKYHIDGKHVNITKP